MATIIVSPLEFVAIAEKMTFAEKLVSLVTNCGLFHDGKVYDVTPRGDDPVIEAERAAALARIAQIGGPAA